MRITRRAWRRSPELYQAETVRRIRSGEKVTAAEYIQRRRELETGRRSIRASVRGSGCAGDADDADAGSGDCRVESRIRSALRPAELRLLRNTRPFNVWGLAGDFGALRIYAERAADRDADRGAALAGGSCVAGGLRVRAGDGMAQAAMVAKRESAAELRSGTISLSEERWVANLPRVLAQAA